MTDTPRTEPSDATEAAEEREAQAEHRADRPPTSEEEATAPTSVEAGVEESYKEMAEKGAAVKGEGELP